MYLVIVESLIIVDKTWETDFLLNKFSCNSGFSCFPKILNSAQCSKGGGGESQDLKMLFLA